MPKKKIKALKKLTLFKLPRILVLVLKRFNLNNVIKENYKINDYLEFPFKLDLNNFAINKKNLKQIILFIIY